MQARLKNRNNNNAGFYTEFLKIKFNPHWTQTTGYGGSRNVVLYQIIPYDNTKFSLQEKGIKKENETQNTPT